MTKANKPNEPDFSILMLSVGNLASIFLWTRIGTIICRQVKMIVFSFSCNINHFYYSQYIIVGCQNNAHQQLIIYRDRIELNFFIKFEIELHYITLHYRHFKCHLHLKWPVVHQQLHVIRNTAHRPSTQDSYTASWVRPKRKISCTAAQISATLTISFPRWRHMSLIVKKLTYFLTKNV